MPKLLDDQRLLDLVEEKPDGWKVHELYARVIAETACAETANAETADAGTTCAGNGLAETAFSDDPLRDVLLFRRNFLLMHQLFRIAARLKASGAGSLVIGSMDIHRVRGLSDSRTQAAEQAGRAGISSLSEPTTPEPNLPEPSDGLAVYYLNTANYFDISREEVQELLDSFWAKLASWHQRGTLLEKLGMDPATSHEQLKQRMRSLAKTHHPDSGGDSETFLKLWHLWEDCKIQASPRAAAKE